MKTVIEFNTEFYCAFVYVVDGVLATAPVLSDGLLAQLKGELGMAVLTRADIEPVPPAPERETAKEIV